MKKTTTLMAAAVLTLAISACGTYKPYECDYYPREHYEAWQENCDTASMSKETTRERRVIRTFNESLEK